MKILVTGGCGFIASHIVDAYVDLGHEVVVVDNLSTGNKSFLNPKAKFYQADIRDKTKIQNIVTSEKPEVVNHHAAQISVRSSVENPIEDAQINLLGLLNLLEAGRTSGVKKIIFASSGGVVYGEAAVLPTPESYQPLQPLSPYGVAKLASELYLNFYCQTYGISYVALRYSNVYGPRQNPHGEAGVVAIFSRKLFKGEKPVINGDGKQTRDYIFVKDVVEANKLALTANKNGAFNIATGKETDVNMIFQLIKKAVGSSISPVHGQAKKGEQKRSCLDITYARHELGFSPQYDLTKGLAETVDYFKKHD